MKVYVLEVGCYENRMAWKVCASAESAMLCWQQDHPKAEPTWTQNEAYWHNGLDWDNAASIYEFDLID